MLCSLSFHTRSLSHAAKNDGRRIILLIYVDIIVKCFIFFSKFLTITKCLLSAQQEEENTAHTGEEKAFTSLTTTVHFCTVYARHEGKIYLTENRSEEKSSFYISWAIEYIRNTNSFIYRIIIGKPVFLLLDWTRSYRMTCCWSLYIYT